MSSIIVFIIGIIVSTIIIYFVTKLFGEKQGIKTAFFAAIIGSIVFTVVYAVLGRSLIPGAIGAIAWLIALKWLYNMKWLKVIAVAVIVWIIASIVGAVIPTGVGPL
jgi:uncharacterized membrane protein